MKIRKKPFKHNIIFWILTFIYFIISKVIYYYSGDKIATACLMIFLFSFIGFTIFSLKVNKTRLARCYKELSNLIWNISTSVTFTYGIYLLIRYKVISKVEKNVSVDYIHIHPLFSYFVLSILVITSIIRASITIAETIEKITSSMANEKPK